MEMMHSERKEMVTKSECRLYMNKLAACFNLFSIDAYSHMYVPHELAYLSQLLAKFFYITNIRI